MDPGRRAFAETADPEAYVARTATEAVLAKLEQWRDEGESAASIACLIAPPGLGKTFLLRVFESRLVGSRPLDRVSPEDTPYASLHAPPHEGLRRDAASLALYLPYAGLLLPDLSAWVHGLLGRPLSASVSEDPDQGALEALLALGDGPESPCFLIVDDAESMPAATARRLARGLRPRGAPLRLLLALNDDARAMRLRATLDDGQEPVEILFRDPMTESETRAYLRARMSWAGVPEPTIASLESTSASRIHALSGGLPRRVHRLAASLLQTGDLPIQGAGDERWREAEWMGRPIDDLEDGEEA
ncbi:MAG: AAA family ATPase [bacterium]